MKKFLSLVTPIFAVCVLALIACGSDGGSSNTGDTEDTTQYGGEPYDITIGNGNYILHNFISNTDNINMYNAADATNHYLSKGETYVKGLASKLETSLKGRPAAQNYFSGLINAVQNDNEFYVDPQYTFGQHFDHAVNTISDAAEPYFVDIIKNLDTTEERYAFYSGYGILNNESYKEGLGRSRQSNNSQMDVYNEDKEFFCNSAQYNSYFANIDLEQEYGANNFRGITNLMDDLVNTAVNNLNNRQGLDLRVDDLRRVVNLGMTTSSFQAMHDITKGSLKHTDCDLSINIVTAMGKTIDQLLLEQTQGKSY